MTTFPQEFYLSFLLGGSCGVLLMVVISEINLSFDNNTKIKSFNAENACLTPEKMTSKEFYTSNEHSKFIGKFDEPILVNDMNSLHQKSGDAVANVLSEKVRVLCWVMTQPPTIASKAKAVKNTWGKHCNLLVFMSSVEDKTFPVVGLNVPEGRENLWLKTRAAWKYVYDKHYNDADWFIKADDDSFIIVENLRYFVSRYNTSDPHYFGRHFVPYGGYNSGGAGYIFSKETLKRFNQILKNPHLCKLKSGAEDVEVGICLAAVNVYPGDTRDELGRETFHPFSPEHHLIPGYIDQGNWLHQYNKYKVITGPDCCSDHAIAFHYVSPNEMYILDYFIYHLHIFGVHHVHD
ncbi:glycoprotein-N-acetylgalactosamine 3-beta-galactosyltransferase 1 [Hydra vulgaris]|uniref:glycoprotein-N-acetylgalactosamine 3-beta-galactosyltransferase 1 n=1 Tax=Hydra vulgaris TaxID=6087 RepID=UPI001F5E50F0|nr:glycoprotein-N-acetylgalactosamine 3-beta-galactosyltransferase 1 [Hydra vulgaris]